MIEVKEAKRIIDEHCSSGRIVPLDLISACGKILAEPVYALVDTPPFDQSAMDGYAFAFDQYDGKSELRIAGEIQAGAYSATAVSSMEAVRIFTGAALPPGADTVVIQEKVVLNGNSISISDELLKKGGNVRLRGSQTKKGNVALEKDVLLTPAGVSYLAGIGIEKVNVFADPDIAIIVTGKELVKPGQELREGEIFESNSSGLVATLKQMAIHSGSVDVVGDDEQEIMNAVAQNSDRDIIILTGGVSVGDYDFVVPALEKSGVKKLFHKVRQKPGKPFYFGRKNDTLVFALPGNPASVLTCFYEYIVPAITRFTHKDYFEKKQLPLAEEYKKKPGLTHFLKGKVKGNEVAILKGQESYLMNTFALADCIIELEEEKEFFAKGEPVIVKMII